MSYFRLGNDCFLIDGERDGVLYDVHGGHVFLLDEAAHQLLRRCEDNLQLDGTLNRRELLFLETLQEVGIGAFHDEPGYVDKLLLHQPVEWMGLGIVPPNYGRVDWSITNSCDMACAFCGQGEGILAWEACQSCLRRRGNEEESWLPEDIADFVAQIAALGVHTLHLRGGNPLLAWVVLEQVERAAQENNLVIAISTPGTGANADRIVKLCQQGQIYLNIILFGADEEQSRSVCKRAGVLNQQLALIDALLDARYPFSTTFLLDGAQRSQRQLFRDFARRRWQGEPSFVEICRREEIGSGFHLSHVSEKSRPLSPWHSGEEFFFRIGHSSCNYGNFELGADGRLRSCVSLDTVHGNVARDGLRQALAQDSLYQTWELSKDKIAGCNGCALRMACLDCTAFELAGTEDEMVRQAYCPRCADDVGLADGATSWNKPFVQVLRLQKQN